MTYTREQILAMELGRELDKLVEEVVFGRIFKSFPMGECFYNVRCWEKPGYYSYSLSAAWSIWQVGIKAEHLMLEYKDGLHWATIHKTKPIGDAYDIDTWTVSAASVEEAIVKCRLLAVLDL